MWVCYHWNLLPITTSSLCEVRHVATCIYALLAWKWIACSWVKCTPLKPSFVVTPSNCIMEIGSLLVSQQYSLHIINLRQDLRVYLSVGHRENFIITSPFYSLLSQVLHRFEQENGGQLLVATMCLLECSCHGLLETELLSILGDEDSLNPPDAEKDKDSSEKGMISGAQHCSSWQESKFARLKMDSY